MKREQRLTHPREFAAVYSKGISRVSNSLVLRALPNNLSVSRFGFSVSKRVGGAVVRNRMKRRLREIMPALPIKPSWDIVFIVRPVAAGSDFATLKKTVESLLTRGGLLEKEALNRLSEEYISNHSVEKRNPEYPTRRPT